jgi:hypothetical protein
LIEIMSLLKNRDRLYWQNRILNISLLHETGKEDNLLTRIFHWDTVSWVRTILTFREIVNNGRSKNKLNT